MKRVVLVMACLMVFTVPAHAEYYPNEKPHQLPEMKMHIMMDGDAMPMGSHMQEMMQSMVAIMKMQKSIIKGIPPSQKKALLMELDKKIEQMEKMCDMPCCMTPATCMPQAPSDQDHPHDHDHEHHLMEK